MEVRSRKPNVSTKESELSMKDNISMQRDVNQHHKWLLHLSLPLFLLLVVRFCSALWNNISDCDETYNYWEPTHYMLYGYGFQTWEYSPVYAIRSYAYIWLHILPGFVFNTLLQFHNKVLIFYLLRCFLGFICGLSEIYFYRSICYHFGNSVGYITLIFLSFGAGMFISSTSYLPSSFSMYMTMISFGAWLFHQYRISIVSTAASALIGWPFAAVLGLPIAYDIIILKRWWFFFTKWCLISLVIILVPVICIDSYYYGKLTVAPLNIILYNVFSGHGPDLYGVEPWTYYFLNGFLNFNVAFVMALLSCPLMIFTHLLFPSSPKKVFAHSWSCISALYLWIAIFFSQSHKEERFLFPIYPLICIAGAISLNLLQKMFSAIIPKNMSHLKLEKLPSFAVLIMFATLSIFRILALCKGYSAPIEIYKQIDDIKERNNVNACTGKEWYRFPSHFFLPHNWRLQFLQSDFHGQLPKPFSNAANATRIIPTDMNDQNREEFSRYVDVTDCQYLIDSDFSRETVLEPRYSQDTKNWKAVYTKPFLDTERCPRLLRAFYIPFVTEKYCKFVNYNLLQYVKN